MMSLKLAARLVAPEPHKIADLQENDTTRHDEDLSAFLPEGTVAILIMPARITGSGSFWAYPVSNAASKIMQCSTQTLTLVPIKNRVLSWKNTTANDDWDIWMYGYFVQRRTR